VNSGTHEQPLIVALELRSRRGRAGWKPGLAADLAAALAWGLFWGRLGPWLLGVVYGLAVALSLVLTVDLPLSPVETLSYGALAATLTGIGTWWPARQMSYTTIECVPSLRWS
jgi:hypothetical protein